ncbi:lysylphosphatidylglycerol synthase transmembrane domain-containing protein [Nanoarchaeota archaeon]
MKSHRFVIWSGIIGILLFIYILLNIELAETLSLLRNASIWAVLLYLFVSLCIMLNHTLRWRLILLSQGVEKPFFTLMSFRIADYTISFLTPGPKVGGEFTRAALLSESGVKYSKALSSTFIDKSMELYGDAIFMVTGIFVATAFIEIPLYWKILLYFFMILFCSLCAFIYISMRKELRLIPRFIEKLMTRVNWKVVDEKIKKFEDRVRDYYVNHKRHFFFTLFLSVFAWVFSLIEFRTLAYIIGYNVTWSQVLLMLIFFGIAIITPVPLALGVAEASQAVVFTLMGLRAGAGVLMAFMTRLRDLIWSAFGLIFLAYYGMQIKQTLHKAIKGEEHKQA